MSKTLTMLSLFKSAFSLYSELFTIKFTIITTSKTFIISSPLISPAILLSTKETLIGITELGFELLELIKIYAISFSAWTKLPSISIL